MDTMEDAQANTFEGEGQRMYSVYYISFYSVTRNPVFVQAFTDCV